MGIHRILQSLAVLLIATFVAGCSTTTSEQRAERPFFQKEYGKETHGRKTWFDHLVEVDPGGLDVEMAPDYMQKAPLVIAVLPFGDIGSANFELNKIPITFRNKEERARWAWTDAQRLRRRLAGYFSQREFYVLNPIGIDAVLEEKGIDSMAKLKRLSPATLGQWFGADAVVYGEVDHYEDYYLFLIAAVQVGMTMRMVSTHDGETLMLVSGSRYSVDLRPALDLPDIAINSGLSLLQLRDVTLARAEEEVAREIVLRVPVSDKLTREIAERTIYRADHHDFGEEAFMDAPGVAVKLDPAPDLHPAAKLDSRTKLDP